MDFEIISKITDIVNLMDKNKDWFIIGLLKEYCNEKEQYILSKISINEFEKRNARIGIERTVNSWIDKEINENKYRNKCNKIIPNCESCKYSTIRTFKHDYFGVSETISYNDWDENSNVCNSCLRRSDILHDKIHKIEEDIKNKYMNVITDDVIELKALMNKIKNKIKDLKHETS